MKKTPPYTLVFEDPRLIAVNKAPGISVGGDRWDEGRERLDRLLEQGGGKVFTVHRIDRDTSGLVLFARDETTHRELSLAFEKRLVKKEYLAVVHGRPSWSETACDLPLVPDGDKLHRTIIDKYRGKSSLTRFRRLLCAGNYSLLEARPETGRTHQIRVHLAALGFPVVCDPLYGRSAGRSIEKGVFLSSFKKGWRGDSLEEKPLLNRLGLHAASLAFSINGAELLLQAPLCRDMNALTGQMKKNASGLPR
ncbi:MAG: RluA family pseudouridine synthase [Treponema sp.]|nr:RluA family pseudouridine synthase [Treponema sp.]